MKRTIFFSDISESPGGLVVETGGLVASLSHPGVVFSRNFRITNFDSLSSSSAMKEQKWGEMDLTGL